MPLSQNSFLQRLLYRAGRLIIEPFRSSNNPPWFDARGVAVGLMIGLSFPIGTHMISMGLLRTVLRYNLVIAFAVTFLNNPVTILPLYYGFYYIGSMVMGASTVISSDDFGDLLKPMLHADHFIDSLKHFMLLGKEIVVRWTIGSILFGAVITPMGYIVTYRLQRRRILRKARNMGLDYQEMLKTMEMSRSEKEEQKDVRDLN